MRRHSTRHQRGFTLPELIVAVFVLGIIGTITLAAFLSGSETIGRIDDDVRGQGDLQIVTERLSRDIRGSRGVDATSTPSVLKVWIDYDADYQQEPVETITWKVQTSPSDPSHFDVLREDDAGGTLVVGRALVNNVAFTYNATPVAKANTVTVAMDYDAITGDYLSQRQITYSVRLRNVL